MKKVAFASDSSTASLATQPTACTQVPTTRTAAYLPRRSSTFSSTRGYLVVLNNNNTYNLYNVNGENDQLTPYTSALTTQSVATSIAVPSSGVIFAEDNVWILSNPTYHGRVTVAAGRLSSTNSSTYADVNIAGPIVYSTKNGSDAIGLVAQDSVVLKPYAPPAAAHSTLKSTAPCWPKAGSLVSGHVRQQSEPLHPRLDQRQPAVPFLRFGRYPPDVDLDVAGRQFAVR